MKKNEHNWKYAVIAFFVGSAVILGMISWLNDEAHSQLRIATHLSNTEMMEETAASTN